MGLKAKIRLLLVRAKKVGGKAVLELRDFSYVTVRVSNPYDRKKAEKAKFLVDTGAACCTIPEALKERLGLPEEGSVEIVMADGRPVPMKVAQVIFEVNGRTHGEWVAYGPNVEPILGMNVLGNLGIIVNTKSRQAYIPLRRFTYRNLVIYGRVSLQPEADREDDIASSDQNSGLGGR